MAGTVCCCTCFSPTAATTTTTTTTTTRSRATCGCKTPGNGEAGHCLLLVLHLLLFNNNISKNNNNNKNNTISTATLTGSCKTPVLGMMKQSTFWVGALAFILRLGEAGHCPVFSVKFSPHLLWLRRNVSMLVQQRATE